MNHVASLACRQCSWTTLCSDLDIVAWLQRHGRLRRAEQPEADLTQEMFRVTADRFACPACGAVGLAVGDPDEADEWESGRACDVCRQVIPPERLEVFPDTRVCAQCKDAEETGQSTEEPEYCPRCGAIMQLRSARGSGISRYQLVCPECGKR